MITKFWFVVLMTGSAVACIGAKGSPPAHAGSREASNRNEDTVLEYLRPVISSSGKAVRLYYRGDCYVNAEHPVPFPFTKVQPPSKGKTGLAAVIEIFKDDKNVNVMEEPVGIIRIWIGKMPTAILRTKLSLLTLDPMQRYNQSMAIGAIENTKEIQAAMRSLGVSPALTLSSSVVQPDKNLPHLPASMRNVTVDQALDVIAKALHHVVVYGACADPTAPDGEKLFLID